MSVSSSAAGRPTLRSIHANSPSSAARERVREMLHSAGKALLLLSAATLVVAGILAVRVALWLPAAP